MTLLNADMLDPPILHARQGRVLEAEKEVGRGIVATVLRRTAWYASAIRSSGRLTAAYARCPTNMGSDQGSARHLVQISGLTTSRAAIRRRWSTTTQSRMIVRGARRRFASPRSRRARHVARSAFQRMQHGGLKELNSS